MKITLMAVTLSVIAAFATGCNQQPTASQQLDNVKAETQQAAHDMKDYTYAEKDAFVKQMQAQLTALDQDINQLTAKIENSSDAVKADAKPKLQALRDQEAQLNKQLADASNATESTWDTVKDGAKKSYDSLKDGFNQSRQWVSDKIAP